MLLRVRCWPSLIVNLHSFSLMIISFSILSWILSSTVSWATQVSNIIDDIKKRHFRCVIFIYINLFHLRFEYNPSSLLFRSISINSFSDCCFVNNLILIFVEVTLAIADSVKYYVKLKRSKLFTITSFFAILL